MKRIEKILITSLIIFVFITAGYAQKGKDILTFGNSAASLGRGGAGVSLTGTELLYLNPASIAGIDRAGISLQYGSLPSHEKIYNPEGAFSFPSSYGSFGVSFRYLNFPHGLDFNNAYRIVLGAAREITSHTMLGFSFDFLYAQRDNYSSFLKRRTLYYPGGTLGFIYKFNSTGSHNGWGLFKPALGISVHFGLPLAEKKSDANFNSVTVGYSFSFYRTQYINLGFFNDATLMNYREYAVKGGLELELFRLITLRGGYIFPYMYNEGIYTAGAGVTLNLANFKGSLNYSLNYYRKMKMTHYLGLTMEFGSVDREAPETRVAADHKYFSPNHDGVKDYLFFTIDVHDQSRIKGWKLQIMNDTGELVKEYALTEQNAITTLSPRGFFRRLFLKRESIVVPEQIVWDDTGRAGLSLPDGRYRYAFTAWDEHGNVASRKKGDVTIDTTSPSVTLSSSDRIFSPNGDRRKETFTLTQKVITAPNDTWKATFTNSAGRVVKSYTWKGTTVPGRLTWDGTDNTGHVLPEGLYTYSIHSHDRAGNSAEAAIREITLTKKYEIADISLSQEYFSFKKAGGIKLFPYLSNFRRLTHWETRVTDIKGDMKRIITGEGRPPKIIEWDCRDSKGAPLADGEYFITFQGTYTSGNTPASFPKKLIIDSTPPGLTLSHSPRLFSPDGDGNDDLLIIKPRVNEQFGTAGWSIRIYSTAGELFKSFSGTGPAPERIYWDGRSTQGELVESAADYLMDFSAVDRAGNSSRTYQQKIAVDVLVLVTERGLKMQISNIEFPFGSDKIKKKGRKILSRVYSILKKYRDYRIIIEGHTDDIGKEEYNLKLSEKRARAVKDYLAGRGMQVDRLQFMGMGETVPLYPNDSDEHRRRNRRVEFLLIKKDK